MKFLSVLLTFLLCLTPMPVQAASYDIEINIFKTIDALLALPFKLLNILLGPVEEEPVLDPEPDSGPVMI